MSQGSLFFPQGNWNCVGKRGQGFRILLLALTQQDGRSVGTVFVAVVTPTSARVEELTLTGTRAEIRRATVDEALRMCRARLDG